MASKIMVKSFDNINCVVVQCECLNQLNEISFKVTTNKKEIKINAKDYLKKYNNEDLKSCCCDNEISKNLSISDIYAHEDNKRYNIFFNVYYDSSSTPYITIDVENKHNNILNIFAFETYAFCSHLMKYTNENGKFKVEQILGNSYKNYYSKFDIIENFTKNKQDDYTDKKRNKYISDIQKKFFN